MTRAEIEAQREALIAAACRVRQNAYAPYSHYSVGAAILIEDGRVFTGVNVENASFGGTICAERAAIGSAITAGARHIAAVAVCTPNGVAPCGICRQVLAEFVVPDEDPPVWMVDDAGNVRESTLASLLPNSFGPRDLPDA